MLVQDGLPLPQRLRALSVIIVGILMAVLDVSMVNMALPDISRELQATPAQATWVLNAYQLVTLALLLPLATLGDIIGYRRVYRAGMLVFVVASLACTFANSLTTLVLARVVQGVGAAGIMSVNVALVRLIYPRNMLGRGMAINSMVVAMATVAGPPIAAAILSVASWPWLFAMNIPFALIALVLGRNNALPDTATKAEGAGFSLLDVVLNGLMFILFLLGIQGLGVDAQTSFGGSARTSFWVPLAELVAGVVVGVIYVRRQLRLTVPLLPLDLLRIPAFVLSLGSSAAAFCAQTLAYVSLPFLLLSVYGLSHIQAGLVLTAWPLGVVATAPFVGRLIGPRSAGLLASLGLLLLSTGLILLAVLPPHPSQADIVWRMIFCGVGFGMFQSPNNHIMVTSAPVHRSGAAGGMLSTARLTGQSLGVALMAIIFSVFDPLSANGSPTAALWLAAALAATAVVCRGIGFRAIQQRSI